MSNTLRGPRRTRIIACALCRKQKAKCEQQAGSLFCKRCLGKGIDCTGPVHTTAWGRKEKEKSAPKFPYPQSIATHSTNEAPFDAEKQVPAQVPQQAFPLPTTRLVNEGSGYSSAVQTPIIIYQDAINAIHSLPQSSSQIQGGFSQVPGHRAPTLDSGLTYFPVLQHCHCDTCQRNFQP